MKEWVVWLQKKCAEALYVKVKIKQNIETSGVILRYSESYYYERKNLCNQLKDKRENFLNSLYMSRKFKNKYIRMQRCFGGRDRDRTCDPYDVNVVLSR